MVKFRLWFVALFFVSSPVLCWAQEEEPADAESLFSQSLTTALEEKADSCECDVLASYVKCVKKKKDALEKAAKSSKAVAKAVGASMSSIKSALKDTASALAAVCEDELAGGGDDSGGDGEGEGEEGGEGPPA